MISGIKPKDLRSWRFDVLHEVGSVDLLFVLHRIVAHGVGVESLGDLLLDAVEGTAADEEDVVGIDLNVV